MPKVPVPDSQQGRSAKSACDDPQLAQQVQVGGLDRIVRESLDRAQDLNAGLFRLREKLKLSELDAEEYHARSVDLEKQLNDSEERHATELQRVVELRAQCVALDEQLSLTLVEFAAQRRRHEQEMQHQQAELDQLEQMRAHANQASRSLADVLSSRSWSLSRPLRRMAQWFRGRPFSEPQVRPLPETVRYIPFGGPPDPAGDGSRSRSTPGQGGF